MRKHRRFSGTTETRNQDRLILTKIQRLEYLGDLRKLYLPPATQSAWLDDEIHLSLRQRVAPLESCHPYCLVQSQERDAEDDTTWVVTLMANH